MAQHGSERQARGMSLLPPTRNMQVLWITRTTGNSQRDLSERTTCSCPMGGTGSVSGKWKSSQEERSGSQVPPPKLQT